MGAGACRQADGEVAAPGAPVPRGPRPIQPADSREEGEAAVAIAGLRARTLKRSNGDDAFVRAGIVTCTSEGCKEDERRGWSGIPPRHRRLAARPWSGLESERDASEQAAWPRTRVHVMQRSAQNVLVEEADGVERLVLSAGGHAASKGRSGQKSFELLLAGQGGWYALHGADVAPQPIDIGFLGGQRAPCVGGGSPPARVGWLPLRA